MNEKDQIIENASSYKKVPVFEEKLYRTLRAISGDMVNEYMESFGIEEGNCSVGETLKSYADSMTEEEFVSAVQSGKIQFGGLSKMEMDVLYAGIYDFNESPDPNCPAPG